MDTERIIKQINESSMYENRILGRPKKAWLDGVNVALKNNDIRSIEDIRSYNLMYECCGSKIGL